jgi:RecB family exonuclease
VRLSYSSISLFRRCPAAWKFNYVDGIPSKVGEAANRGSRLHACAEKFFAGALTPEQLPVDFWRVRPWMEIVRTQKPTPEYRVWLSFDWEATDEQGTNGPAVLLCIFDVLCIHGPDAAVFDLKTGRVYPEHAEQLELYAAAVLSAFPNVETARVGAVYIDSGELLHERSYARAELPALQRAWDERRAAIMAETEFAPTPGLACRFCSYAQSKGGPCRAGT